MNTVEPIRDSYILRCIAEDLKADSIRNFMIFMCGLYTGRRITDVLNLKVSDLKDKDYIFVRESKTKKQILLPVSRELKKCMNEYLKGMQPHEYIFKSTQKHGNPIHRSTFYKILNAAARKYGLEHIGCHTMRKTFGYHHYQEYKDLVILQEIFGHSDIAITKRYIGINQETINNTVKNLKLF